ncbi:MAG: hypothetical protein ABI193_14300 [Minicystis sp.]
MDLDGNALIASLFVGSAGFVSFAYGKKMRRLPQMIVGLAMMIYPYFVSNVALMLGVCAGLFAALYVAVRAGY